MDKVQELLHEYGNEALALDMELERIAGQGRGPRLVAIATALSYAVKKRHLPEEADTNQSIQ